MEQQAGKVATEEEMLLADRAIRRAGTIAVAAMVLAVPAAYLLVPVIIELPQSLGGRLRLAAGASVLVCCSLLVAVFLVSLGRRHSPADIAGSAAAPPSEKIAVHVAFLQNTLEQAFLSVVLYFALALMLPVDWLPLIPMAVVFFLVGRVLFLRGYARGAGGRALGMTLTMLPTVAGYGLALVLMVF